jgi:hypothetical protein
MSEVKITSHGQRSGITALESLEGRLVGVQNSYVIGLAGIAVLGNPAGRRLLLGAREMFGSFPAQFDQVAYYLADERNREEALKQFAIVLLRDLDTIGFQLLEERCGAVGARRELEATDFYQFARIIRNCVSHNFRIEYRKFDRSLLPLTWRGLTLTEEMDGGELPLAFFGWEQAWTLHMDYIAFAKKLDAKLSIAPYPNRPVVAP